MRNASGIALSVLFCLPVVGCLATGDVDTTARGEATFEDASTDRQGEAQPASSPDAQSMFVEIIVEGSGELTGLEPQCSLDSASGSFDGLFAGDADIDDDGVFVAGLASGEAQFTTPSGCEIPELQISTVGEVIVRATIETTTTNCQSYCQAKARSHGETMCGADASAASCRASAEAEYSASCSTSCRTSAHVIVAESRLSVQALAELNARAISGAALGDIDIDVTFDRIEDTRGEQVPEQN